MIEPSHMAKGEVPDQTPHWKALALLAISLLGDYSKNVKVVEISQLHYSVWFN